MDVGAVFLLVGVTLAGSAVVALGAARLGVPALVRVLGDRDAARLRRAGQYRLRRR